MKHSKSSMFLMELIIAILFFALASAVCIQLFAKSHLISKETVNQNHAISQAQNLAELWYATDGDLDKMHLMLQNGTVSEDGACLVLMFDEDWNPITADTAPGQPVYCAKLLSTDCHDTAVQDTDEKKSGSGEDLKRARVYIYLKDDKGTVSDTTLYTLELIQHTAVRRGEL